MELKEGDSWLAPSSQSWDPHPSVASGSGSNAEGGPWGAHTTSHLEQDRTWSLQEDSAPSGFHWKLLTCKVLWAAILVLIPSRRGLDPREKPGTCMQPLLVGLGPF